jgi:hypothetical protein
MKLLLLVVVLVKDKGYYVKRKLKWKTVDSRLLVHCACRVGVAFLWIPTIFYVSFFVGLPGFACASNCGPTTTIPDS